jgi:hypothetical protein
VFRARGSPPASPSAVTLAPLDSPSRTQTGSLTLTKRSVLASQSLQLAGTSTSSTAVHGDLSMSDEEVRWLGHVGGADFAQFKHRGPTKAKLPPPSFPRQCFKEALRWQNRRMEIGMKTGNRFAQGEAMKARGALWHSLCEQPHPIISSDLTCIVCLLDSW